MQIERRRSSSLRLHPRQAILNRLSRLTAGDFPFRIVNPFALLHGVATFFQRDFALATAATDLIDEGTVCRSIQIGRRHPVDSLISFFPRLENLQQGHLHEVVSVRRQPRWAGAPQHPFEVSTEPGHYCIMGLWVAFLQISQSLSLLEDSTADNGFSRAAGNFRLRY